MLGGKVVSAAEYKEELNELALVCGLCNDSSVIFSEVRDNHCTGLHRTTLHEHATLCVQLCGGP